MALATLDALLAALPGQWRGIQKGSLTTEGAGTWQSLWLATGQPGAGVAPATGTGAVPTSATAGALPLVNAGGANSLYLARAAIAGQSTGTIILYDRLWASSGLNGTLLTAQTVNSLALTRPDANGAGVELWGEVYTAMGATAATFTASYTNQDGTSGRSATYVMPANALTVGQMVPFLLQAGDTGVRSVQSLTLSASTGTAGSFGLTLLRRVAEIPLALTNIANVQDAFALGLPRIDASACLAFMVLCNGATTGTIQGSLAIVEG